MPLLRLWSQGNWGKGKGKAKGKALALLAAKVAAKGRGKGKGGGKKTGKCSAEDLDAESIEPTEPDDEQEEEEEEEEEVSSARHPGTRQSPRIRSSRVQPRTPPQADLLRRSDVYIYIYTRSLIPKGYCR